MPTRVGNSELINWSKIMQKKQQNEKNVKILNRECKLQYYFKVWIFQSFKQKQFFDFLFEILKKLKNLFRIAHHDPMSWWLVFQGTVIIISNHCIETLFEPFITTKWCHDDVYFRALWSLLQIMVTGLIFLLGQS